MTEPNHQHGEQQVSNIKRYWLFTLFLLLEIVVIIFYGRFTDYGAYGDPLTADKNTEKTQEHITHYYTFFQDVHVMIFIGFGFLMTFLKSYSWSAVGFNFVIAAWILQISVLLFGFWNRVWSGMWNQKIELSIHSIIDSDFAAGTILISFGAVLGKLHFMQYLVMATIEAILVAMVTTLGYSVFGAVDIGGSMFIHCFGAYFGLACTVVINSRKKGHYNNPLCESNYRSNTFSMIGTIFLWMFWPSFNAALGSGAMQHRAIINTLISMTGSCFTVFILNPFFKHGKFDMEDALNATISGGVIIGASADIIVYPYIALIIGCLAGALSITGFNLLGPYLARKINLHDTCGVHNLHGMPGFSGGLIAAILAGLATSEIYGPSLGLAFPMVGSGARTNGLQAGWQLAGLVLAWGVAVVGGVLTGFLLKIPCFEEVETPFDDHCLWETNDEEGQALKHVSHLKLERFKTGMFAQTDIELNRIESENK
jgi:ammonium transporter Rh